MHHRLSAVISAKRDGSKPLNQIFLPGRQDEVFTRRKSARAGNYCKLYLWITIDSLTLFIQHLRHYLHILRTVTFHCMAARCQTNSVGYAFLRYYRTRDACQILTIPIPCIQRQSVIINHPHMSHIAQNTAMMECTPQTLAASPGIVLLHTVSVSMNKLSRTVKHTASILGYKIRKSRIQEDGCTITIIPRNITQRIEASSLRTTHCRRTGIIQYVTVLH